MKGGGDHRTADALEREGASKIDRLRERGWDLGRGDDDGARADAIYAQARRALYAVLDPGVVRDTSPRHVWIRTLARDRDDYLEHPPSGESIRGDDADRVVSLVAPAGRGPRVQVVISDGLNANALNEHLRAVLPPLRRELSAAGLRTSDHDVVIQNGRVRAGYHVGGLTDADVVIHLIGERPGTGLDTLSAYLTYGRDAGGQRRWRADLDHSATTAVCGIHRHGKPPAEAVGEIARVTRRIIDTARSGVSL
jgi:ethanolamine ammonia-lyase small subunit